MKKLLVTVIGAAVAFGATATIGPGENFEARNRGEITVAQLGSYWSEPNDDSKTNQYEIVDSSGEAYTGDNALQVKTVFGKPLTFNVNSSKTGESMGPEFYFDSAVKFTVCEDAPDATYNDAKIVMWLQETEDGSATNLFVRAGYLSVGNQGVTVTPSNYVHSANIPGDFADQYHRVTIKALPDITNGQNVPGFAIWIDGDSQVAFTVNTGTRTDKKWDGSFTYSLTEAANYLDYTKYGALFPSLVQDSNDPGTTKTTITGASFDGTGWVEELKFAATAPFGDAADFVEPKGSYTIGEQDGVEFKTIEQLAAAIKNYAGAEVETVTVLFTKGFEVDTPFELANNENIGEVVIDFNGCVITNTSSAYMITNNAVQLTFVDASGKGGIRCTSNAETAGAVYNAEGNVVVNSGNFWGKVLSEGRPGRFQISGGSFLQGDDDLGKHLVPGKAMQLNGETDMYDVVDATYTINFVYGEGLATTTTLNNVAYNATPTAPTSQDVAVLGKTFTGWDKTVVAATADATYVAQYTINNYTIKFVYGAGLATTGTVEVAHGETPSAPQGSTADITGKTFAGWSPAIVAATADATYVAQYNVITYTIKFVYGEGLATTTTVNNVAYGVVPTAPTSQDVAVSGKTFNGWDKTVVAATADATYVAQYTQDEPEAPTIPDSASSVDVPGTGEETPAQIAEIENSVKVDQPTDTGVSDETYQGYFTKTAEYDSGKSAYVVTATVREDIQEAAANDAVKILDGTSEDGKVTVPKGLYYEITTMTSLDDDKPGVQRGMSDGNDISVSKPAGSTQGFIRIKMGNKNYESAP